MPRTVRLHSRRLDARRSGTLVAITPRQAGWKYVRFAVRQFAARETFAARTGTDEICLVLLEGRCRVVADGRVRATLGPRANVFSGYPHALYLPPHTTFSIAARERTVIADCRAPAALREPQGRPERRRRTVVRT